LQPYLIDPRVTIIKKSHNSSYSEGVLAALKLCKGLPVLTFHSDLQYSPLKFILINKNAITRCITDSKFIIGKRVGRSLSASFWGLCLMIFSSYFLKMPVVDYNGQPKLFLNNLNLTNFDKLRSFSIDIALCYATSSEWEVLESQEKPRINGDSSWKKTFFSKICLSYNYLVELCKIRKYISKAR
jgi:hypothetical protein